MHLTHSESPPSKITLKPLINVDIKFKIISAEFPVSLLWSQASWTLNHDCVMIIGKNKHELANGLDIVINIG